jgi:hypothetical protein
VGVPDESHAVKDMERSSPLGIQLCSRLEPSAQVPERAHT